MKTLKWDITYKCKLNCGHCINGDFLGNLSNELDYTDIKKIINKLKDNGFSHVQLLGGEPFDRKDIICIMNQFEASKLEYGINTNALKLSNEEIKTHIINSKYLKNIVCSLEAHTKEINDKIRGKNVFNTITKNIKEITKLVEEYNLDIKIAINTVVCQSNKKYIKEIIELCIKLGVKEISFLELIIEGNANDSESISFEDSLELAKLVSEQAKIYQGIITIIPQFLKPIYNEYVNKYYNLNLPIINHYCSAGLSFGYMDNRGQLYPCDRVATRILRRKLNTQLNLAKNDFFDIWDNDIFSLPYIGINDQKYYDLYPCNKCKYFKKNCFPCYLLNVGRVERCAKIFEMLEDNQ